MMRRVYTGVLSLLLLGCGGDDGGGVPGTSSDSSGPGSTLPLPTASSTGVVDDTTTAAESSGSGGPDGSTGVSVDAPGPQIDDCARLDELVDALPGAADPDGLFDDFVEQVGYGEHGFPITCEGTLGVVHRGGPGESFSVAGDFNGWVAGEVPLMEPAPGLYYARVELPAEPQGLYKLVHDETVFFADPLARRFGWDRFGEYSQVDPMGDRGHHERYWDFDQGAGTLQPRTITVYLPVGAFDEPSLPVLYMHDGQNLFSPEAFLGGWQVSETLEVAIADGTLDPVVVVGIDNTSDRVDEYTPVTDDLGAGPVGGRADEYADFVVDGIKPFIEQRYPVSVDAAQVGMMGSSLGGLVSLYIGRRHPDVFGQIASMSGTIAWGTLGAANPTIVDLYLRDSPGGSRIYLDSGGDEGMGCPDGGFDNYCGNVQMADALRGLGWVDEVDLFYRWQPGAPHSEPAWASRFLPAMIDWFSAAG